MKYLSSAFLLAATASSSWGISMRDDVTNVGLTTTANPYVNLGSLYNAVAYIDIGATSATAGSFKGTGTLVTSSTGDFKFLTAAHNLDSDGNGVIDQASFGIYFGAAISAGDLPGTTSARVFVTPGNIAINSKWSSATPGGFNLSASGPGDALVAKAAQYDVAVITFSLANVFSGALPTPMGVSLENPVGQTIISVGYGNHGLGTTPFANTDDSIRRGMNNVIDVFGYAADSSANTGFAAQADFDSPTNPAKSSTGATTPLSVAGGFYEGATAGGDSGGPIIYNNMVVGVLNGGFNPNGNVSEYGDRSIWAVTSETSNQAFLTAQGVAFSAVPEPAETVAMTAVGLGVFAFILRRRRA